MKDLATDFNYGRRAFFQQLALGGAGLYLFPTLYSCDNNKYPPLKFGTGNPPFSVWEEMIHALKKSPDNLAARRDALVAAKDAQAMTEFIRDDLQVLPYYRTYFRHLDSQTHYGKKAALRCGLATPREKAELLKDMLVEAGFEAKVVLERTEMTEDAVKDILFTPRQAKFEPPVNPKKYKEWAEKLGVSETAGLYETIEDAASQGETLANSLLNKIGDAYKKKDSVLKYHFGKSGVPSVIFMEDGQEKYAHVFDPAVPFGFLHPTNSENKFRDAQEYKENDDTLTLTVSSTNAFTGKDETEIISGTWKMSEVVGNQLKINFLNNMPFEVQAKRSVAAISNFTPCMALQDIYKDEEYLKERSFLGEPITLEGEKILKDAIFKKNEDTANPSETIEEVVSVSINAYPKTFPSVRLEIFPKNKDGAVVEGLKAADFSLQDNGETVSGIMRQNVIAPKILVLYDNSLSMPSDYRGEGALTFQQQLKETIQSEYPFAQIKLQKTGSTIYTSHLKAAQTDNDLILYATDGHNSDEFNPKYKAVYKDGPPTLYLNVYDGSKDYFNELAKNTSATVILAKDREATLSEIRNYIDQLSFPPYVFTYNSFNESKVHTVEVALKTIQKKDQATFTFQQGVDNAVGNRITGLYLDLKIGNRKIRRVLAGWDKEIDYHEKPSKKMVDDVHEFMLGGTVIAFERECPPLSVRLTEYLQCMMSHRNWMEAHQAGNTKKAIEELGKGVHSYPSMLVSMMQPLQNNVSENSITFPNGYRVGIVKFKPGFYQNKTAVSFDYVPTSEYMSVTRDGKNVFSETTRKTAQFALLENQVFETNTLSQLADKELVFNRKVSNEDRYSSNTLGDDYRYFRERIFRGPVLKLFDASAEIKSFWSIDHDTGELYGVLPDQTGGGGQSVQAQLEALDRVVKQYEQLMGGIRLSMLATGAGGVALGIVAIYGVTLVKLYALASEAIILMDASGLDEDVRDALKALACNIFKSLVYKGLGPVGKGIQGVDLLIASMGGGSTGCS